MKSITIDFNFLEEEKLNINEYLILYNLANKNIIEKRIQYDENDLYYLEKRGWLKLIDGKVILRQNTIEKFIPKKDHFLTWLLDYPIKVNKSNGGSRHLSPASDETILGRQLRKKWESIFKGKPINKQQEAIDILNAHVKMMKKSGDLEYMVEATRWLNAGYYEQYAYLLTEDGSKTHNGANTNYKEDYL